MWLQHGWLGDNAWFITNGKSEEDRARFRDPERLAELDRLLTRHRIRDVFPHLCPAEPDGSIAKVNGEQVERMLDALGAKRILPWVGGVLGVSVQPSLPAWRERFVGSVHELLALHPRLAGVQLNVEPCSSEEPGMLALLEELKAALPVDAVLSVAAYPPPTILHPFGDVHWNEPFYRRVASVADQMVPMMYDTSLRFRMLYRRIMASWTKEVLAWSEGTPTLLGLPAYDDAGSGYHDPSVENLEEALWGVHEGLAELPALPDAYRGVAIYSDWEMTEAEWQTMHTRFLAE